MNPDKAHPEPLAKTYEPHTIEQKTYAAWEQAGHFSPVTDTSAQTYCIMLPPPNVTGSLHMGHAFQDTLMDALIRYHRMLGDETLWQGGSDHAGIATQMVVERQLESEGKTRHDLGREEFIARVWRWKAQSGGRITEQMRRLGASVDWSRERFTLDAGLSHAVTEVFVRLYEEGLIYRGKRLVNWDPVLHTAVSDLEVVSEEEAGHLWHMRYPLADGSGTAIVVATTRPETMLGDAAVAVHPDDERYRHLIGKTVRLPLAEREIPVIADEYVDPAFGSGCVKITPAHDFNDYQVWLRHKDSDALKALPDNGLINIFTVDARVLDDDADLIPPAYRGLDRFAARKRIIADLTQAGLMEHIQDHKLMVPRGDRTGAVIEPLLTDQWFVKTQPLAEPAIAAVERGDIRFVPENWTKTYFEWMRNIEDWCISRQIWWGHRVPAWYDEAGNIFVAHTDEDAHAQARAHHGSDVTLTRDADVLDTWFSSALWPFSTLGWPEQTRELQSFYPTNVLVTGFDIIFFWVARMIMMGLKFTGDVPFREVYIHGLVRDAHGEKMSKSKGNVLDPIDLIDGIDLETLVIKRTTGLMQPEMAKKIERQTRQDFPDGIPAFGTDALRFTFAILATQGRDIKFDLGRIEGYRNFCNKLWNASRYVLMNTEGHDVGLDGGETEHSVADRWILSRLQQVEQEVETGFNQYRFDLAAQAVYSFVWDEYCSWYLELSKVVLTDAQSSTARLRATRHTLILVLEAILRLLHPMMPFITEEIWQRVRALAGKTGDTIMHQPFPRAEAGQIDVEAIRELQWVMAVITGIRNIRGEMDIPPAKPLQALLHEGVESDQRYLERNRAYLITLARLASIAWLAPHEEAPESATALVGNMEILLPLGALIDKQAETQRLGKEIEKSAKELAKEKARLANSDFMARAPKQVVDEAQRRVADLETKLASLSAQRAKVEALS